MRAVNIDNKLTLRETPLLLFEFHGSPAGVQEQAETVQAITAEHGGMDFEWAERPEDRSRLGPRGTMPISPACNCGRAAAPAPPTCACRFRAWPIACARPSTNSSAPVSVHHRGPCGDGNFHVLMLLDADSPQEWQESETINHNLVRRAIAADGTCTGEHGVGLHKMQFMAEEHGEEALASCAASPHAFDPNNILNPGKIIAW